MWTYKIKDLNGMTISPFFVDILQSSTFRVSFIILIVELEIIWKFILMLWENEKERERNVSNSELNIDKL